MRTEKGRWFNWGLYPGVTGTVHGPGSIAELKELVATGGPLIARGAGRSYGDASLAREMVQLQDMPHILELDPAAGTLRCGAGIMLDEILLHIVPQGFFLPVTPGTRFVTLGGAIAADVHGKNHHKEGSFSAFVDEITIMDARGNVLTCSPFSHADLFHSTCGGMGLTGIILEATFRLKRITSAYIDQRSERCADLDQLLERLDATSGSTYSVAWIDLVTGGPTTRAIGTALEGTCGSYGSERKCKKRSLKVHSKGFLNVPFHFPSFVLGPWSVGMFNALYYHKPSSNDHGMVHYAPYFYPLDAVRNWNRIYGRRGFLQYQFALPKTAGAKGIRRLVDAIQRQRMGSFLSVLKLFGPGDPRKPLSFPLEGYTLALDIAVTPTVFAVLNELDRVVAELGGRLYLAKDARMSPELLRETYPLARFGPLVHGKQDGPAKFASIQSERLAPPPR